MTILIIVILLAVLLMIWLVTVQRKLVVMDENISDAMSQIGVQLSLCFDAMMVLLNTAEGYAADETRLLSENVRSFRITITARSTPDKVQGQERILSEVAERLIAIAEAYPDFKADKNYARYMLFAQSGKVSLDQEWNVSGADYCRFDVEEENGEFTLVIEEVQDSWCRRNRQFDVQQECAGAAERFRQFCDSMPSVPQEYEETREIAAYVNWSSIVRQMGFLKREAMFMSKNWMCNVWSWDHCFNAMALSYQNPKEAWDQFMIMFDQQSATGRIPDSINDSVIIDNYCKPPIHGWALRKLRKQMELSREQLEEAYEKLGKWTNWWLNYRDQDGDGLCEYTHGNDSGWDNATAFRMLPPVTLPDLAAFLIIQMEVLSEVAEETGRSKDSRMWAQKAADMKSAMEKKLFRDGEPCAIQTVTGEKIENDSLILYLPIILGKRLPENIREYLVSQLKSERFLTAYGLATEDPSSKLYVSDGYWRGPVWAPSTMLIVDGLWECGEEELVKVIARRFCDSVRQSGCAENFDALTGEGLRDRAYTWTASVMLVMAHEYLENPSQCC